MLRILSPVARVTFLMSSPAKRQLISTSPIVAMETKKVLTADSINPHVIKAEYAVRGELVLRAGDLQARISKGEKLPFPKVVLCNIGNPQSLQQQPITFFRQVCCIFLILLTDAGTSFVSLPSFAE